MKNFKNIIVDKETKTFTILYGDKGTYAYQDVLFCRILYEEDKYKGKVPIFSHIVSGNSIGNSLFFHGNVWCGIGFEMKDGSIIYAYISDCASQYNSLQFHDDTRKAEEFIKFIAKHKVLFKNISFDTDSKTFTIYKGSKGTYSYTDIVKCKKDIEYENDYYSVTKLSQMALKNNNEKVIYKVYFRMKDESLIYVEISNKPVFINSNQAFVDLKISNDVYTLTKRIINKYRK